MKGFYKAHAGALFFVFTILLFYFIFISVLDRIPDEIRLSWNLIFARIILHSWWMVGLFAALSLAYTIKSVQYVCSEITKQKNQVVQYCGQCFSRKHNLLLFTFLQIQIMLPLFGYSLFICFVGLLFEFSIKAIFLISWQLILLCFSTFIYVVQLYKPTERWNSFLSLRNNIFRKKSLSSLYLWHVADHLKLLFILTKLISWILILGIFLSTDLGNGNPIYNYFSASIVMLANSLIVFQEYKFKTDYVYWSYNFPQTKWQFFTHGMWIYVFLLLPEILWMIKYFTFLQTICLFFWMISILVVYRGLMYAIGANMKIFLKWLFFLFLAFYLLSIYGLALYASPVLLGIGYGLFKDHFPLKMVNR